MLKNDVLKVMQSIAKKKGYELTLQEVDEFLKIIEETYATVGEQLMPKESCNVGCIKVEKKEVKPRNGKSELNGKETTWSKPGLIKINLKAKDSFKKKHTTEI